MLLDHRLPKEEAGPIYLGDVGSFSQHAQAKMLATIVVPAAASSSVESLSRAAKAISAVSQATGSSYAAPPLLRPFLRSSSDANSTALDSLLRNAISISRQAATPSYKGKEKEQPRDLISAILDAIAQQPGECEEYRDLFSEIDAQDWRDDEVLGFARKILRESFDSLSSVIERTLLLLASYPSELALVQAELDSVTSPAVLSPRDLERLPHLAACVMETSRLFPPLQEIHRHCISDTVIECVTRDPPSNVFIPLGSTVTLDVIALHRSPEYWGRESEEFKPERFRRSGVLAVPSNAFFGFGSGLVGSEFASVAVLAFLARLLLHYSPEKPPTDVSRWRLGHWTRGWRLVRNGVFGPDLGPAAAPPRGFLFLRPRHIEKAG